MKCALFWIWPELRNLNSLFYSPVCKELTNFFFSADWYGKESLYLIWASQRCVSLSFFCCCVVVVFLLTLNWWTVGFISLDFVQSGLVAVQFTQLCIKGMLKPSLFVSMACFESSILNSNSSHILLWIPITYSPFSRKLLSVTIQFITSALQINCTVCIQKEWGCCSVKGFLLPDECEILQEHTCNNEISAQCMVFAYKYCFFCEKKVNISHLKEIVQRFTSDLSCKLNRQTETK